MNSTEVLHHWLLGRMERARWEDWVNTYEFVYDPYHSEAEQITNNLADAMSTYYFDSLAYYSDQNHHLMNNGLFVDLVKECLENANWIKLAEMFMKS